VNPEWLKGFLANPSLSTTDVNRNGVRSYLQVRMPTSFCPTMKFAHWCYSLRRLSSQPQPFIPQKLTPITTAEKDMARQLFTSTAAPCLKCHATGDAAHDKTAIDSEFLVREGSPAAGLDREVDHQPGVDRAGNGHAIGIVQTRWRPLGIRRAAPRELSRVHGETTRTCWCAICFN